MLALAIALAASTAHADIGVVVTGEATLQPQLASQLEGWLKERGHVVQPSSLEPEAINTLIDCFVIDDIGCARAVVEKRARVQTILFARIEMTPNRSDGSRDIAISGYWLAKGHEPLQERRTCKHCTEKQMRAAADDLMLALAAEPPTGAATTRAAPARTVAQAEPGSPPPPAQQTDEQPSSKALPITVTAVGGVALIGGVVMIATGGPPSADKEFYRDYRTPGYVVGAAGAVALGVGVYLLLRPTAHSAPVASITHGGAVFGWSGRF
ncbi:MAG TPA: hypothetical protein VH143_35065 [Kofleriaceae bacterium]|nr:hypothetical protein [Kofleriaceae bacterium]